LTKTVPIQVSDQPSQMWPKVMNFVGIQLERTSSWIFWFLKNRICFRNGTFESLVFNVLRTFQNHKFLENSTKIPCFIEGKNSKVDKRHLCEQCGKNIVQNQVRWGRNGWSKLAIQCNSTQNHTNPRPKEGYQMFARWFQTW
jgi:hypothetical protein